MIPRKLVAHALRALPLLMLPVILAPVALLALGGGGTGSRYASVATIWVLNPSQIQEAPLNVENPYLTPAQRQAAVIGDLLLTQDFRLDIAQRAGFNLASAEGSVPASAEAARRAASAAVQESVYVSAAGSNLLRVTAVYPQPEGAQRLAAALIAAYDERLRSESQRQDSIATTYFTQQLTAAEEELAKRRRALESHLSLHPGASDPASGDLEYVVLLARVEAQNRLIEGINQAIQDTHLNTVTSSQALAARFNVVDEPTLPLEPVAVSRTQQFGMPLAAAMLGGLVSAGYLLLRYRTDHSIRSREDLTDLSVPFLGYTPRVKPPRGWVPFLRRRRARGHARRLAASFSGRT